jgi:hypothetical protein
MAGSFGIERRFRVASHDSFAPLNIWQPIIEFQGQITCSSDFRENEVARIKKAGLSRPGCSHSDVTSPVNRLGNRIKGITAKATLIGKAMATYLQGAIIYSLSHLFDRQRC